MKTKKRILIAPLDWGIGHATRCIPIINALINHNYEVIIAADGRPLHLLTTEFPKLEIIRFEGYNIKYPKYFPMSLNMILQIPKILLGIKKEHKNIKQIIQDYKIDGVISDNRFGISTSTAPCVFITHQLQIQSSFFTDAIQNFNYEYIHKYNACWIMDDKKTNLAGSLSKPNILPNNSIYIGPQSRFEYQDTKKKYDFLAIVSGPEPQRTILEKGLIKTLKDRKEKSLIVLGKPEFKDKEQIGNLTTKSHLTAIELNTAMLQSKLVICRPGYSTIMDLAKLGKKAIFIPTPGQTEQEYLAKNFMKERICFAQKQSKFDFEKAISENKKYTGFSSHKNTTNWIDLFSVFN
ncbi:MAG: glycosyltransferase [Bacteroidota bacterium]|nr:glycosyltransferase [Bacteroidota bacterium]